MRAWVVGFLIAVTMAACTTPTPADVANDNAAIRALSVRQAEAWNRHDAKAYASLFSADCDAVNVTGAWWNGRAELERNLAAAQATAFKDSSLTLTDVQVRFLAPRFALMHMRWAMTGVTSQPGSAQPKQGIQTLVLHKQDGAWLIDALQNTNTVAER